MIKINSVLLADNIDKNCARILNENGIKTLDLPAELKKKGITKKDEVLKELLNEIKNHEGIIVRSATTVTKEVLDAAPGLRLIGRAGTGVDNIDMKEATKRGVVVMNTPCGNSRSAAELTCTMMMNLARHVPQAHRQMNNGVWARKEYMGSEVYGKTLAIIGLGRIGKEVALRMQAFGMKTVGYDPIVTVQAAAEFGVESLQLDQIWPIADFITVHVPLIPQTKNLVGLETLAKCKKGVRVINVARGGVVDEAEILKSVEGGHCGGAAFDVFQTEPPFDDITTKALIGNDKVITTPHLGASTLEAQHRVAVEIAEQFVAFHLSKDILGALNARPLVALLDSANEPSITAVQNLASLLTYQKHKSTVAQLVVEFSPDSSNLSDALKASVVVGFLKATFPNVNMINAAGLAQDANITVKSSPNDALFRGSFAVILLDGSSKEFARAVGCASQAGCILTNLNGHGFYPGVVIKGLVHVSNTKNALAETNPVTVASSTDNQYFITVLNKVTAELKQKLILDNSVVEI